MPVERIGNTMVKTYRDDLRWQWGREVAFLRRVQDLSNFPQILAIGDHSITTRYCGESIATHPEVPHDSIRGQLMGILGVLDARQIRHRDITEHNVLWNNGTLVLIDFGWSVWDWEEETPAPLPHVMAGLNRPDWVQARELLAQLEGVAK